MYSFYFLIVPGPCCCLRAFSTSSAWGLLYSCGEQPSHYCGFPCHTTQALECAGFRSYHTQAQLPLSIWNLPGPGTESMPPALTGRFLTTGRPEKSNNLLCFYFYFLFLMGKRFEWSLHQRRDRQQINTTTPQIGATSLSQ